MWPAAWAWTKIASGAPAREGNALLSYFLAVLAACANATSSVLQRKANKGIPQNENLSWKLIRSLLHQPVWFFGILAITVGFLLQASALGAGQLAPPSLASPCPTRSSRSCGACSRFMRGCRAGRSTC